MYDVFLFLYLTILLHVHFEAFGEAASLALVASRHIHHASSILFADVVQITVRMVFEQLTSEIHYINIPKLVIGPL